RDDACRAAGRGLETTRDATSDIVRGFISEAGETLGRSHPTRPDEKPPEPFTAIGRESGPGQVSDVETIHVLDRGVDLWFHFGADQIKVWRRTAPEEYLVGFVPLETLLRRL